MSNGSIMTEKAIHIVDVVVGRNNTDGVSAYGGRVPAQLDGLRRRGSTGVDHHRHPSRNVVNTYLRHALAQLRFQ